MQWGFEPGYPENRAETRSGREIRISKSPLGVELQSVKKAPKSLRGRGHRGRQAWALARPPATGLQVREGRPRLILGVSRRQGTVVCSRMTWKFRWLMAPSFYQGNALWLSLKSPTSDRL